MVLMAYSIVKGDVEKKAFEQMQIRKGLLKFVDRYVNERWGTFEEVERWKSEGATFEDEEDE